MHDHDLVGRYQRRVRIDIYLQPAPSGESLHAAISSGEVLTQDLRRFEPEPEGRAALLAHLANLQKERWIWSVEENALLVRIYGLAPELSTVFGCEIRATGSDRCDIRGTPSLPGYDRWIEATESSGRAVRGAPAVRCAVLGHDWDIILFDSPYGLLECMRCSTRQDNLPGRGDRERRRGPAANTGPEN
jgi:hypothetical protein